MSTTGTGPHPAPDGFELAGVGLNVYESPQPVEGTAKWLESPEDVIAFVESGEDVSDVIVLARGGATTFLTMALNAGVRAVITLQGAPESHLGILSREYGIPCLMSVAFERGVRTSRGEIIPADGVRLRLDVSARPKGTVSVESGAPVDDSPAPETGPAMSPEQLAQIQLLLENYLGEVPHGTAGNDIMLARQATSVLDLDAPAPGELTPAEVNDFLHYLAWNEWDALAARATEGESGLIPRQEYEAVGILNCWFRHPEWMAAIQDRVGEDGIVEIASRARTEIGTKINLLHNWALAAAPSFGRGIALELKLHDFPYRTDRITRTMSTARRLYQGLWGGGPVFSSMREYRAPILDKSWIARFEADRISLGDHGERQAFQRFNGAVELLGFLVHFDNRLGLGDHGPYPTDDGGFVIVRDLFINEPAFPWSDTTAGLPYAVTIAMFFAAGAGLRTQITDLSTLFTEPANYLPYVTGVAAYTREQFDTPVDRLRRLSLDDMTRLRTDAEAKSEVLYKRIAAMSKREKVLAGALVYTSGFALPFARAAGMYDELVREHAFNEVHPVVEACYDTIVSGVATEMIPRLFLTGSWANDVPDESREAALTGPGELEVLRAVRCRGLANAEQIAASTGLAAAGIEAVLAAAAESGFVKRRQGRVSGVSLTPTGRARLVLLTSDSVTSEQLAALTAAYDAFLAPNRELKSLTTAWQADQDAAAALAALEAVHADIIPVIAAAAAAQPRFQRYQPRLSQPLESFRGGDGAALARPMSESYHDVWMELHEDLLTTMGQTRSDTDGS